MNTALAVFLALSSPTGEMHPRDAVTHWAKVWMIPTATAHRLAFAESSYNPEAVSEDDARGVLQVLDRDSKWLVSRYAPGPYNWRSASHSARVGFGYLAGLRARFGSLRLAVTAYHMGPTAFARGDVPGPRTVAYVKKILEQ